jgi:hypothetical protein
MAKLQEQVIVVKFSRLVRDRDPDSDTIVDSEFIVNAESVLQELVGNSATVEVVADL